jgi:hypothetical protein
MRRNDRVGWYARWSCMLDVTSWCSIRSASEQEVKMRRHVAIAGLLIAGSVVSTGPANAQMQSCNVDEKVAAMEKESESASGPGLYIRGARRTLTSFKKNILELKDKHGVLPPVPPMTAADQTRIKAKIDDYANVDKDNAELTELLRDIVGGQSKLCLRCVQWPTWKVFQDAEYPFVTASILDQMKSRERAFANLKQAAVGLKDAAAGGGDESTALKDGFRLRIRRILSGVEFDDVSMDWEERYNAMKDKNEAKQMFNEMKRTNATECPSKASN